MQSALHNRARRQRRRTAPRQEGMVLLVVMFVLMMATAMAAVGLKMSRSALHESGAYRTAMQSRYLTEGVLQLCIALTDDASEWRNTTDAPGTLALFQRYGTRGTDAIHETRRISAANMTAGLNAVESPVYQAPSAANGNVGTLGTSTAYSPGNAVTAGRDDFMCYVFDCRNYSAGNPGANVSQESGSNAAAVKKSNLCQIAAHSRMEAAGSVARTWAAVPGQTGVYTQVLQGVTRKAVGSFIMQTE